MVCVRCCTCDLSRMQRMDFPQGHVAIADIPTRVDRTINCPLRIYEFKQVLQNLRVCWVRPEVCFLSFLKSKVLFLPDPFTAPYYPCFRTLTVRWECTCFYYLNLSKLTSKLLQNNDNKVKVIYRLFVIWRYEIRAACHIWRRTGGSWWPGDQYCVLSIVLVTARIAAASVCVQ
jgi:hypothetical protein